jgi:predicted dehydrogenase
MPTLGVGIIGVSPDRGWAATAHIPALRALGEFADLSALSDLRRPLITIGETGEQIVKTAADQIALIGTLTSGVTASVHIREAVAGGIGFLWEINGTDGTLRVTADAPYPGIVPLTVAGARGRDDPAELAV